MRCRSLLLVLALAAVMLGGAVPLPADSPIEQQSELFPAAPAVNEQRGFAIAMDGEWLAVGAHLEDVNGLNEADAPGVKNAGAVHLFQFEKQTGNWRERAKLTSDLPQEKGQFGFAVALRGNLLAVGEPGRRAVHVFLRQGNQWFRQNPPAAPDDTEQFGRSVAIDGSWLAVGAGDPQGDKPGVVHLFSGPSWTNPAALMGNPEQPDERFGQSISLFGGALAVGAPGADDAKGAVYLFQLDNGQWRQTVRVSGPTSEGDQFGFAVAVQDQDVVIGAPTFGNTNAGAAWVFRQGAGDLTRLPESSAPEPGGQLGYAVAIAGDRIAVGAPDPFEGGLGAVQVFTRAAGVWSGPVLLPVDNTDPFGLSGFSVAVSGEWVIFGTILGDYGGDAVGSISSFRCRPECVSKGDVVVKGEAANERFGISIDADGDMFAIGACEEIFFTLEACDENPGRGSVTLFRRAAKGWRQEARLVAPAADQPDRFGASVAVHQDPVEGDLLAVGDPSGAHLEFLGGAVLLFRKKGEEWELEATLLPPIRSGHEFGRSVATDGRTVVVGAGSDAPQSPRGAAYAFEHEDGKWSEAIPLVQPPLGPDELGDAFGFAVSVQGDTIAVGAPFANSPNGQVHLFHRDERGGWLWQKALEGGTGDKLGFAIAIEGDTLVAGAPGNADAGTDAGSVSVFEGPEWLRRHVLSAHLAPGNPTTSNQAFGAGVDVRGRHLVVGAPVLGFRNPDPDKVFLFERQGEEPWKLVETVDAIGRIPGGSQGEIPPLGDHFGTAVALGDGFFVVTSPGKPGGGERVLVVELSGKESQEEQP